MDEDVDEDEARAEEALLQLLDHSVLAQRAEALALVDLQQAGPAQERLESGQNSQFGLQENSKYKVLKPLSFHSPPHPLSP